MHWSQQHLLKAHHAHPKSSPLIHLSSPDIRLPVSDIRVHSFWPWTTLLRGLCRSRTQTATPLTHHFTSPACERSLTPMHKRNERPTSLRHATRHCCRHPCCLPLAMRLDPFLLPPTCTWAGSMHLRLLHPFNLKMNVDVPPSAHHSMQQCRPASRPQRHAPQADSQHCQQRDPGGVRDLWRAGFL